MSQPCKTCRTDGAINYCFLRKAECWGQCIPEEEGMEAQSNYAVFKCTIRDRIDCEDCEGEGWLSHPLEQLAEAAE